MDIRLHLYENEIDVAISLIKKFWKEHNDYEMSTEEAQEDLTEWTKEGHKLYLIKCEEAVIGFVHLGSRGGAIDWLEDLYVMSEYQNKGIGTCAVRLAEEIVKEYSESLYIEAAARNEKAIRLYAKLGYSCLNTITVRKDFEPENFEVMKTEKIHNQEFEIKRYKE